MCLYLDGISMDKPIDIFESSFGRGWDVTKLSEKTS